MKRTLATRVLVERRDELWGGFPKLPLCKRLVRDEIINVDLANRRVGCAEEPAPQLNRWLSPILLEERVRVPSDPSVTLADLHDWTAERRDADHRTVCVCAIAD